MSTPLFAPLFAYIEANLDKKISIEDAARTVFLSPVHATRLFSFAYGITPAEYIRRRKLSESLRLLLETDRTVLEIALRFGFSHEQSFTRAFFAEFGTTPGKYRSGHTELPVLLPILDYGIPCGDADGRLFGPGTVFLPKIRLLGVWHEIPYRNSAALAPKAALGFWEKDRLELPGGANATVFYGLTRHPAKNESGGMPAKSSHYLTAIGTDADDLSQTGFLPAVHPPHTPDGIPATDSFGGCPCIKFHYIGRHHYRELSQKTARQMYCALRKHIYSPDAIPAVDGNVHLEKINTSGVSDEYCLMEWYAPIYV